MARTEPIRGDLQRFSKELEKFVAQSMARIAKICYCGDLSRKGFGEGLVGCVAVEFAEVEGSGGRISRKDTG